MKTEYEAKPPEMDQPKGEPPCKKWFHSDKVGSVGRVKRTQAFDMMVEGGEDGYTFKKKEPGLNTVSPTGKAYTIIYKGKGEVILSGTKWTPIPTISAQSELVNYATSDKKDKEVEFAVDRLNNLYVRSTVGSKDIKLAFNIGEDGNYYYPGKTFNKSLYLPDIRGGAMPDAVAPAIKKRVEPLISKVGLNKDDIAINIILKLAKFFGSFKCEKITGKDQLIDSITNRRGACRHRAMGFFAMAGVLGIPCRYIINDCHAFVEVGDGRGYWWGMDLGGCMPEGGEAVPDTDPEQDVPDYGDSDPGDAPDTPEGPGKPPSDPSDDRGQQEDSFINKVLKIFVNEYGHTQNEADVCGEVMRKK